MLPGFLERLSFDRFLCLVVLAFCFTACTRNSAKDLAKGDAEFAAGKYNEAIIYYRNAVQANPKLARAHYQLAQAYFHVKAFPSAFEQLQSTIELDPGNSEARLQLASLLISTRKYDDAKAAALKVLAAEPNNARAHAILADVLAFKGDPAGAIKEYRVAIDENPHLVEIRLALGAVYASQGAFSSAESVLKEAIESNPQSEPARLALASFYLSRKDVAQAKAELITASKLAPRDPKPLLTLADADLAQGDRAEAEKVSAQAKNTWPDDPSAYRALAELYLATGQREKALAELDSLHKSKPEDAWVNATLSELLLDSNRVQEASMLIERMLSANPNDPRALTLKGRVLLSQRNYPEAQSNLQKAVKADDRNSAGWYYLGMAQQFLGLPDLSRSSFAKAHDLSPGAISPRIALAEIDANRDDFGEAANLAASNGGDPRAEAIAARAELAKGNLKKAEELVRADLARNPASIPALEVLLKAYAREGRLQQATGLLADLVSKYPQNPGLYLLLARAYLQANDWRKAEANVRRALALDAQVQDAHALLAAIDSAQGLTGQAITEWKTEIAAHPHTDGNYLALANAYEAQSNWSEAIGTLQRARAVGVNSPYVNNNLAYLYLEHGGDVNLALSLAQEAVRALPGSPLAAGTLGWAFYKTGAYDSAISQLSVATKKLPDNAEDEYHLGMAYLRTRQFDLARESLQRALKINPAFADAENVKAALNTLGRPGA